MSIAKLNIFGGAEVKVDDNKLVIHTDTVASWSVSDVGVKTVTLTFNNAVVTSGTTLKEAGRLVVSVTSEAEKTAEAEITLTYDAIY